ncbi:MAG: hypothetical protein E6K12_09205 [Methanobacteriota archaeon]|nr:MAG: hypothetical protein E6K15_06340 [Euryarchaeota archaeon]TLZ65553.1 MAG: hypothetical protein E6K12_09205 [Euryarchaeota archaeon]
MTRVCAFGRLVAGLSCVPRGATSRTWTCLHVGGIGADDELSSRQREISSLVWNLGYFDIPARIGLENLAELTSLSQNTVSPHSRRDVPDPAGVPRATKPVNGTETHPPGADMASNRPASIRTTRAGWRRSRGGLQPGCLSYISVTTTVTSAECVMEPIVAVTVTV